MKIAVIGAGYVGLVTGVSLAAGGRHEITFVERSQDRLEELRHGRMPIEEPASRTSSPGRASGSPSWTRSPPLRRPTSSSWPSRPPSARTASRT